MQPLCEKGTKSMLKHDSDPVLSGEQDFSYHTVWLALTWYLVVGILTFAFALQIATGPVGVAPAGFRCRGS